MNREVYCYEFDSSVPHEEIENTLLLAVLAAESLHGKSRVRLDASYYYDTEKRACVIEAGTDVTRNIAALFAGFAIQEFGERAFTVSRVDKMPEHKKQKIPA